MTSKTADTPDQKFKGLNTRSICNKGETMTSKTTTKDNKLKRQDPEAWARYERIMREKREQQEQTREYERKHRAEYDRKQHEREQLEKEQKRKQYETELFYKELGQHQRRCEQRKRDQIDAQYYIKQRLLKQSKCDHPSNLQMYMYGKLVCANCEKSFECEKVRKIYDDSRKAYYENKKKEEEAENTKDGCNHLKVTNAKGLTACTRCGKHFGCAHLSKENLNGTTVCFGCGTELDDEVVYINAGYDFTYKNNPNTRCGPNNKSDSFASDDASQPTTLTPTLPTPSEIAGGMTKSIAGLKKMAKVRGIKYYTRMNKEELCEVLDVMPSSPPNKYMFKDTKTGKEHGFSTIYKASKGMNVNPGLVSYYLGKEMKIGESIYSVTRL